MQEGAVGPRFAVALREVAALAARQGPIAGGAVHAGVRIRVRRLAPPAHWVAREDKVLASGALPVPWPRRRHHAARVRLSAPSAVSVAGVLVVPASGAKPVANAVPLAAGRAVRIRRAAPPASCIPGELEVPALSAVP